MARPKSFVAIVEPPPPEPKIVKKVKVKKPKEVVVKNDQSIKQRKIIFKQMRELQD